MPKQHHQRQGHQVEKINFDPTQDFTFLELVFPDAPRHLTSTEITAVLSAITYMHDLALSKEEPDHLPGGIVQYQHPRHRLRTPPEQALRVEKLSYGSPLEAVLAVPDPHVAAILVGLLGLAGVIVTQKEKTKRESLRQQGETERERIHTKKTQQDSAGREAFPPVPPQLQWTPRSERAGSGDSSAADAPKSTPLSIEEQAGSAIDLIKGVMSRERKSSS